MFSRGAILNRLQSLGSISVMVRGTIMIGEFILINLCEILKHDFVYVERKQK